SDAHRLVTVTYVANNGQTEHTYSTSGDWTTTITPSHVQLPVLTAAADGTGTFISCTITRDGVVMDRNTANGSSSTVTCQPGQLTTRGNRSNSQHAAQPS
ncbi:MAG: hypothetical protein JOY78_13895, partial [Pseudonocardia sp.]|nr:hypothetical protein [Pseudonocardia sp.]